MASTVRARAGPAHPAGFTIGVVLRTSVSGLDQCAWPPETTSWPAWPGLLGSRACWPGPPVPPSGGPMTDQSAPGDVIRLDGVTETYRAGFRPRWRASAWASRRGKWWPSWSSGSGKSTLLNLIAGLDRPTAGTVTVAGRRIDTLGEGALARFRARHVGIIFRVLQPAGRPDGGGQRAAARPARRGVPAAGAGAGRRTARADGNRGTPRRLSGAAVRGTATAGGHREGACELARAAAGRRADRSAGHHHRAGDREPPAPAQRRRADAGSW